MTDMDLADYLLACQASHPSGRSGGEIVIGGESSDHAVTDLVKEQVVCPLFVLQASQHELSAAITETRRQLVLLAKLDAFIRALECVEHLKKLGAALAAAEEARQAEVDALKVVIALRNDEDLINEREAMKRLNVSESTIKRMRSEGGLPFVRVGVGEKLVRYRPSVIAAMM